MGSADRFKRSPFLVAHCAHIHSFSELELPPSLQLSENSCLCQGHLRISMGYSVSLLSTALESFCSTHENSPRFLSGDSRNCEARKGEGIVGSRFDFCQ